MFKKNLFIDLDNVLVDFQSGINQLSEETKVQFKDRLDEVPGIFGLKKPMPGAVESFGLLSGKFDTYILSTAPWENPSAWSDKLLWVKIYMGKAAHKRLILTHHKNLLKGDFLVDDREKNGAKDFAGDWIQFGKAPFFGWDEVVNYLMLQA